MTTLAHPGGDPHHGVGQSRAWRIVSGAMLVVGGILALLMPGIAALATTLVFAWVILLAGGFELVYAFHTRGQPGFAWRLVSSLLTLVLGAVVLVVPLVGITTLALLVGVFLFVGGVARAALAMQLKPLRGWGWILADAILSILLAILVVVGWPGTSLALIGFLTGIWLLWAGVWRIAMSAHEG